MRAFRIQTRHILFFAAAVVMIGVGHAPHLEIATRFNRDLAEFVRSIR